MGLMKRFPNKKPPVTTEDIHITPINDLCEHDERRGCWCGPVLRQEGDTVLVIHQAADGRDLIERHGVQ